MRLYVVATPIGNLQDMSPRAVETLRSVNGIVAEDTRRTRALLSHFDLHKPLFSLPAFDERARAVPLIARMRAGQSLALVTDAGTPTVSDPGGALVDAAWDAGIQVIPIPGPSAAVAALSASGLVATRWIFAGFLPRKGEARRQAMEWLLGAGETFVLYEAGNRLAETLEDLARVFGARRALVARELTKLHEETRRESLPALAERFREGARGEVMVVVEGAAAPVAIAGPPLEEAIVARLVAGESVRDVATALAAEYGLPRQQAYAQVLERKKNRT